MIILKRLTLSISISAIFVLMMLGINTLFGYFLDLPVVYYSIATQECSYVDIKGEKYNCNNISDKYHVAWIK